MPKGTEMIWVVKPTFPFSCLDPGILSFKQSSARLIWKNYANLDQITVFLEEYIADGVYPTDRLAALSDITMRSETKKVHLVGNSLRRSYQRLTV
jgi:hypothetical protein